MLLPLLDHPYLPHYKSPTALSHTHHLTWKISSLLHSVDLILFTVLLVHLILCISPHHSHHLRSHHLSLPLPFTPDLKLISFTNPFLHSQSFLPDCLHGMDLNLYWIKGALLFVLITATCAVYSAFESTLNSLSYRILMNSSGYRQDHKGSTATEINPVWRLIQLINGINLW